MTDIICGNGLKIISTDSFQINVTHRKDGNSNEYPDSVKIIISGVDLPGLSENKSDWTVENLQSVIVNAFLKCEIDSKTPEGDLIAKVSHSGAAGY